MAIAFDSASSGQSTTSSVTVAHTISGSNRVLIVAGEDNGGSNWSVTYPVGGVPTTMTQVNTSDTASGLKLFYLLNPDTGTNNIVATKSSGTFIVITAASYTGVSQTGFPDNSVKNTYPSSGAATEPITLTPTVANCWVVGAAFVNSNATTTAGAGTTIRATNNNASGGVGLGDNNAAINPAASTTLYFVSTATGRAGLALSMKPSSAPVSSNSRFLVFM